MASAMHGKAFLAVLQGGVVVETLPITQETWVIGRDNGDMTIDDSEISTSHCQIKLIGEDFHLFDLNSTNGTFVNSKRILKSKLQSGDEIKIGLTSFRFITGEDLQKESAAGMKKTKSTHETKTEVQPPEAYPEKAPSPETQLLIDSLREEKKRQVKRAVMVIDAQYGDERQEIIDLPERMFIIGRLSTKGRFDQDEELSRRHAQLSVTAEGDVELADMGSTNGTFLNDEIIKEPRIIQPDDHVRVGRTNFKVFLKLRMSEN